MKSKILVDMACMATRATITTKAGMEGIAGTGTAGMAASGLFTGAYNPNWQCIAPNFTPQVQMVQMSQPALLTQREQILQDQLQCEHQQFEAWKLEVETALQTYLTQPQAQAPSSNSIWACNK